MSDWSDDIPIKKNKAKKAPVVDDAWSDEEQPVQKVSKKPKPQKFEEKWSDDETTIIPDKGNKKKAAKNDWSDEEEEPKPKKTSKKPQSNDWSDDEPKKKQKTSTKSSKKQQNDWSDDEPVQKSKKPVSKPKKQDSWSDEEPEPPKKSKKKPVVANDWSDEEPEPVKTKKKPSKKEDTWSDEEPEPAKPKKKPVKSNDWSDEEEPAPKPKKSAAPVEKPKKKVIDNSGWSDDEQTEIQPPKKAAKPTKKPANNGWSDDEDQEVEKITKKVKNTKISSEKWSDDESTIIPTGPKRKPVEAAKPKKVVESDDDDDFSNTRAEKDTTFGGNDRRFEKKEDKNDSGSDSDGDDKSEKEREPVTYVPDYMAEEDDDIYSKTIQSGIHFSQYDEIEAQVTAAVSDETIELYNFKRWSDLKRLHDQLRQNITSSKRLNWKVPTPIQKTGTIKLMLEKKDVMGCAQTGSGKTGAFGIPIIQNLSLKKEKEEEDGVNSDADSVNSDDSEASNKRRRRDRACCKPYALIVAPTRELVQQIKKSFVQLSKNMDNINTQYICGGHAVRSQLEQIEGCDILVATPGRLNDFLGKQKISLDNLEYLVIDEADRMMEMGFSEVLSDLAEKMPDKSKRQTSMFSATFPDEVQVKIREFLNDNYFYVVIGTVGGAAQTVTQTFIELQEGDNKQSKLFDILEEAKEKNERTLVFVDTRRMTDFLATKLSESDFPATSIHGDRAQSEREEALRTFETSEYPILVATNVAARGLDIKGVDHVINFDMPKDIDEYVHRIGRSGRCGNKGRSTSFYNSTKNKMIATKLRLTLENAQQEVPSFLIRDAGGDSGMAPSMMAGADGGDDDSDW